MSDQALTLTHQGWQKLSVGDLDGAVEILTRAILANDNDTDAKALLGMAYSQKGLHAQAKRALQTAVEMAPGNPDFRCNHGVVLERAGELPAAAAAYQQAIQMNPQHELSRQRLQAIGHVAPLPQPAPPPQPPFQQQAQQAAPLPQMPVFGTPVTSQAQSPWQPASNPPFQPGGSTPAAPAQANKPGHVTCARCGEETRAGLSCEWCSAPLRPPTPAAQPSAGPSPTGHVPHPPMEASVAMAALHATATSRRENQREWLGNVWLVRGGIGVLGLAVSIGLGVFRSSMRSASRDRRSTTTISLNINGQQTQFKGASAIFDKTLGGQLYISTDGDDDKNFMIGLPTQVSSPSQLAGQTLTSANNMSEMQTFDPDDFPDMMMVDGHMYVGERVTANVSTATDKQVTLTLDGSFREVDLSGSGLKPAIPVTGTITLKVIRD